MAVIETWLRQDLKGLVTVRSLQGQVFSLDNGGNLIGVKVTKDYKPVTLTGTVTGYCILSDGQTVTVTGSGNAGIQNGNEAYIVLPQLVYSVPGQISIVIKLTSGNTTTTLAACTGYVYRSRTSNEVVPPGTPIPDLATMEEVIRRATAATDAANAATVGAEKVDASMTKEGDVITISVTDRDGNVTEKTVTDQTEAIKRKADIDGYYEELAAGTADQLVSTEAVTDTTPYLYRKSGGSVDIGNRETLEKIVGGTVGWNQLMNGEVMSDASDWSAGSTTVTASDGVLTLTADGDNLARSAILKASAFGEAFDGHVYMYSVDAIANRDGLVWSAGMDRGSVNYNKIFNSISISSAWGNFSNVIKFTLIEGRTPGIRFGATADAMADGDYISLKNLMRIDFTAMFGQTIADYVYNLEQATAGAGVTWFRKLFPKDYYPYNPGELISVKPSSHDMVGFNVWDGEQDAGRLDPTNGNPIAELAYNRSKNYIPCIPNSQYYARTEGNPGTFVVVFFDANKNYIGYLPTASVRNSVFTAPQGARYFKFYATNTATNICINLSHSGSRDGEYEPYEKHSYPLADVELRGPIAIDADGELVHSGDEYTPDGNVKRKYGIVDLGTLNWKYSDIEGHKRFRVNFVAKNNSSNLICPRYEAVGYTAVFNNIKVGIAIHSDGTQLVVYDPSFNNAAAFKAAMDGVYLLYELATPTIEQVAPYTPVQVVDDWGTEEFVDTREVAIPVGHSTSYMANLRDKLQHLPSLADTDGDYIVRQSGSQMSLVGLGNTAEVTAIKNDISELQSTASAQGIYIETESLPIVSISDGADDQPMKAVNVAIEPVQDLHGYDAPWPGGARKNLFNVDAINLGKSYDGGTNANRACMTILVPEGTYTASIQSIGTLTEISVGRSKEEYPLSALGGVVEAGALNDTTKSRQVTINSTYPYLYVFMSKTGITLDDCKSCKIMVESGSTATTYEPYSNICPITGWTGAKVTRTGKNLLNLDRAFEFISGNNKTKRIFDTSKAYRWLAGNNYARNDDITAVIDEIDPQNGVVRITTNYNAYGPAFPITVKPSEQYYLGFSATVGQANVTTSFYDSDGNWISNYMSSSSRLITIPENCKTMMIIVSGSPQTTVEVSGLRLVLTNDATFEPYVGQTYEITFPADPGTVYGGTLDVVKGTLTVTHGVVDLGALTWAKTSSDIVFYSIDIEAHKTTVPVCSHYLGMDDVSSNSAAYHKGDKTCCFLRTGNQRFYIRDDSHAEETAEQFKTAMSGVQLVYELKTPQTYTLTKTEIQTILGYNVVWSDSGDVSVEYPADTKTYIDNRINSTRKLIAGIETGFAASKAYAVGDMLIIGDDLYKVASSIASGATITVGTNVTKTTVAEQLLALANA